jgi:RNA polymerase sigma-70 factor (ECF subfamily)
LLDKAISELDDDHREAYLLRMVEDLSFAEIAEIVGAKEETVRWRVFKAREALQKRLGDYSQRGFSIRHHDVR